MNLLDSLISGDSKALARAISLVENNVGQAHKIFSLLNNKNKSVVIGITGPPGVGKSSLVALLANKLTEKKMRVGIIAIDPSSPEHSGALLGDRIRMNKLFLNPNIFIRSFSTHGYLGGVNEHTENIIRLMKTNRRDFVLIETVGVGQSEIKIVNLVDRVLVVLSPGAGDEIQLLKSGVMEIADAVVLNKCDHADADVFYSIMKNNLRIRKNLQGVPVLKVSATQNTGVEELVDFILPTPKFIH